MNCREFWNSLPQRGAITGEQSEHLAGCAACGAAWEPHRVLGERLHALAREMRELEAPARVEAGLTAAFRAQAGYEIRRSLHRSWWMPVFAWASAAVAMIALATALMRSHQPAGPPPGTVAAPRRTAPALVQTASLETEADDVASTLGDGFVPLPNAPRIDPNEEYNVVRVEVPGSAIIAMGVSVGEDRASATLVADVALGPDGTARAVRLVSDGGTF